MTALPGEYEMTDLERLIEAVNEAERLRKLFELCLAVLKSRLQPSMITSGGDY